LDVEDTSSGKAFFKRMYICFKRVKDGWLAGCRKAIGLDDCFLKHTYRGELLTAMRRDRNNQMYHIAWAIVRVENEENGSWFLSLLHDDLNLNNEDGLTIISDSHKGLLSVVADWLPQAEHRKLLDESAYDYLIERNLNSWSRAFFEMDRRYVAFENGISESFNRAILLPRHKPIITMLEEIRIYIMQRLVAMNKLALSLEDTKSPSIRKQLEKLKEKQREWLVILSGFQELKVRKGDESYGVDLMNKVCGCRMWELSRVPCVHAMADYMHLNKDPDNGKGSSHQQKKALKLIGVGRRITCSNCWEQGHNKAGCKNELRPQPEKVVKPIGRNRQPVRPQCASGGGGRGSRGGRIGRGNETMNVNEDVQAGVGRGNAGVGRGNTVGRGRGIGRRGGGRGIGRKGTSELLETPATGYSGGPLTDEQETTRVEQEYLARYRAEQEYEARMDWMHESHWQSDEDMLANNPTQPTQQSDVQQVQAMATQQSVNHQVQESVDLNPSLDHVQDMQEDGATASSTKKNGKRPMSTDMQADEITPPPIKHNLCEK
ncbi:putative reverse transcriptase domain-containing protein, partial [Tanacetum coccineum]